MKELQEQITSAHWFNQDGKLPPFIQEQKETAYKVFEEKGFPTVKEEDWRFTNLRQVFKKDLNVQTKRTDEAVTYDNVKPYLLHEVDSYTLVFINGVYSSFLSRTTHNEADICVLSSVLEKEKYAEVLKKHFNQIADANQSLVALNTAYAKEGAFIHIPKNTTLSKPIQILYINTEENTLYNTRNLIIAEESAEVKIIERHQSLGEQASVTNAVTEVYAAANAFVDYYKIQNDSPKAKLIDATFTHQEKDSVASFHTFSLGGIFTRNDLNFKQNGENCNSILKGITLAEGEQFVDHHTKVEHVSPNCESHELYRTILDDQAKGVFNGKVLVEADAQKIDAFQQNNNILLSQDAQIDTVPQLEIFADDVKCSHGCTVGQLDKEAMFYLQSRGIGKKEAKALLLFAFSADVLESITIPQLKERVTETIAKKLNVNLMV